MRSHPLTSFHKKRTGHKLFAMASFDGHMLEIEYRLEDDKADIHYPRWGEASRRNGLWEATCFEFFMKNRGENKYIEGNFSPDGSWNIYSFDDYRSGMKEANLVTDPIINYKGGILRASIPISNLGFIQGKAQIGLCAIIHTHSGILYYALNHPTTKPDFHHHDSFTLSL
jgi:hypothetical protein